MVGITRRLLFMLRQAMPTVELAGNISKEYPNAESLLPEFEIRLIFPVFIEYIAVHMYNILPRQATIRKLSFSTGKNREYFKCRKLNRTGFS